MESKSKVIVQKNEIRGEILGEERVLRGCHEALLLMESNSGLGLFQLSMQAGTGALGYRQVTAVIHAGLVGAGDKSMNFEQVGELVFNTGFNEAYKVAQKLLLVCFKGPHTLDKDAAADQKKT